MKEALGGTVLCAVLLGGCGGEPAGPSGPNHIAHEAIGL